MKITLQQWRSFLVLADSLSFTEAAERLHIRQPTLSSNIRNLEEAIGAKLFDRDTKRVELTALGASCRGLAERLLDEAERAEIELRQYLSGNRGQIRVASVPNIFPTLLAPALAAFRAARPEVSMQFADTTSDEAIYQVRQGKVDIAIGLSRGGEEDLRYQKLGEQRLVALLQAKHPLASQDVIEWSDLRDQPLILVQSRDSVGLQVAHTLRESGIAPRIDYRVNELTTAVALLDSGFGIALMGHNTAEYAVRPGFVIKEICSPSIAGQLFLMTRADKEMSPLLKDFVKTIMEKKEEVEYLFIGRIN
jgi:LysR family carnitine catabolism transcriptional activator